MKYAYEILDQNKLVVAGADLESIAKAICNSMAGYTYRESVIFEIRGELSVNSQNIWIDNDILPTHILRFLGLLTTTKTPTQDLGNVHLVIRQLPETLEDNHD